MNIGILLKEFCTTFVVLWMMDFFFTETHHYHFMPSKTRSMLFQMLIGQVTKMTTLPLVPTLAVISFSRALKSRK